MRKRILGLFIAIFPLITSCSSMLSVGHNDFVCKATEKAGMCAPVSEVYSIYTNKKPQVFTFSASSTSKGKMVCKEELVGDEEEIVCREVKPKIPHKVYSYFPKKVKVKEIKVPVRKTEKIQRVWIFPYVDKKGNFIDGHFIYVVVEEGKWLDYKGREVD